MAIVIAANTALAGAGTLFKDEIGLLDWGVEFGRAASNTMNTSNKVARSKDNKSQGPRVATARSDKRITSR